MIGPTIARLRNSRGMSQAALAAKCQRLGLDISREVLARIEGRVRYITDAEIVILARALGVEIFELFERKIVTAFLKASSAPQRE